MKRDKVESFPLSKHQKLVKKKFRGLPRDEEHTLKYLRWRRLIPTLCERKSSRVMPWRLK